MFVLLTGIFGGLGLGLGLALTVLFALEIVLLYYLTWEFLKKENLIMYGGLIFTAVWFVVFGMYADQLSAMGISENILVIIMAAMASVSAILALAPLVMYAIKSSSFGANRKTYASYKQQYEERDAAGNLQGNGLVNKYDEITTGLDKVVTDLSKIQKEFGGVKEKYVQAQKTPELVFTAADNNADANRALNVAGNNVIQTPNNNRPNMNYVVVGVGGTGIGYTVSLIEYLESTGAFAQNQINPYAFFAYDTDTRTIQPFLNKYPNQPNIQRLMHCNATLNNRLTPTNLLAANPGLTNQPVTIMNGTGTRRGVGAAAYNVIGEDLTDFMVQKIGELRVDTGLNNWAVVVLSSIGGGTGSGSFIQLTMDLKKKMKDVLNIQDPLVLWFGIMPKSNEGDLYKLNAFGAIKELQFLFETTEARVARLGQADNNVISNPFDACFLLSRESANQKRDEELKDALVHFMSEIGFVPTGHNAPNVRLDLNDIRTRLRHAANSFATLNYYQIYFPASILSWYRNCAQPVLRINDASLTNVTKTADTLLVTSEKIQIAASNYITVVDNFITETIKPFQQLSAYKKWMVEVQAWNDALNGYVANLKHTYNFGELTNRATSIRDTNIREVQENSNNLNSLVLSEKSKLVNPDSSGVYKQVPIDDPDGFDLTQLTDARSTLRSVVDTLGKLELLQTYLLPLTNSFGEGEQPLARIDFQQMNRPKLLGQAGVEFVKAYQPNLVHKDRQNDNTLEIVANPKIESIILLASSCADNLRDPFPGLTQIQRNIALSAENGYAEVALTVVPSKRFTISVYWLVAGLYVWRLNPKETPILKDLKFLSESYETVSTGRLQDKMDLFKNHTLFYTDTARLEAIIGAAPRGNPIIKRDWVTDFWVRYDPSNVSVGTWGTFLLALIYDTSDTFYGQLGEFEKSISQIERISSFSKVDFASLNNALQKLDGSYQTLLPNLEDLAEFYVKLEKCGKAEILEALNKVIDLLAGIQADCEDFSDKSDKYKTKIEALQTVGLLEGRNKNQLLQTLERSQKTLTSISSSINNIVVGQGK